MTKNDKVEEAKKEEGSQFNVQVDCKAIRIIYLQKTSTFQFRFVTMSLSLTPMSPEAASERVLTEIRSSSLHFIVQGISIFFVHHDQKEIHQSHHRTLKVSQPQVQMEEHSNIDLLARIQDLESHKEKLEHQVKVKKYLENSDNHVKFLEDNLMKAEADMFKHSQQFKIATDNLTNEIKFLKESIKKSSQELIE